MLKQFISNSRASIQNLRFYSQLFSAGINVWIGIQFYLFVKYVENGGEGFFVSRPPGVEGWLPIGSLVSLKYFFQTGIVNNIHPSGMFIFIAILLTAFLFKKGFCGWICPIGFISEMLGNLSEKIFKKKIVPPKWLDYPLRSIKYLLLLFFMWAVVYSMSLPAIEGFIHTDYNKITDVLMMKFFTDITLFSLVVVVILFALSLVIRGFWCRYFCPYGALLGLLNFISPTRIIRKVSSCTSCSSCSIACPAFIKVDKVVEVVSDECIGCMACVDSCPVSNTLEIVSVSRKRPVSKLKWAISLLVVFWGILLFVKLFGTWDNAITMDEYIRLLSNLETQGYTHP